MKSFFFKIITLITLLIIFSCVKTENLNIKGTWNLNSMQCKTYNFYQEYQLILAENDSLGKNAIIILPSKDSLKTPYNLFNDKILEFTSDTIGNWKGKHEIKKWTTNSLNFSVNTDSCRLFFQFRK